MDHRQLLRTIAAGRVVVGVALVALPGTSAGTWIGPVAKDPAVKVMTRAMGARDLAIGLGTLHALQEGASAGRGRWPGPRPTSPMRPPPLLAFRHLGARRAIPLLLVATAAGIASFVASEHLRRLRLTGAVGLALVASGHHEAQQVTVHDGLVGRRRRLRLAEVHRPLVHPGHHDGVAQRGVDLVPLEVGDATTPLASA